MTALLGLGARLRLAKLYLCTDARTETGDLPEFLEAVLHGGVDIVQIWQPGLDPEVELAALETARTAAQRYQALVVVNDSVELAGRFGADVVHLGPSGRPTAAARRTLDRYTLIGRSSHSTAEIDEAVADPDADYFSFGPIYPTSTIPDAQPVGLDLVRHAARVAPIADVATKPWFAIGGIGPATIDDVIESGARRVAVVSAITQADDPGAAARSLGDRLRRAWREDPAMESYALAATAWTGPDR